MLAGHSTRVLDGSQDSWVVSEPTWLCGAGSGDPRPVPSFRGHRLCRTAPELGTPLPPGHEGSLIGSLQDTVSTPVSPDPGVFALAFVQSFIILPAPPRPGAAHAGPGGLRTRTHIYTRTQGVTHTHNTHAHTHTRTLSSHFSAKPGIKNVASTDKSQEVSELKLQFCL